MKLNDNQKKGIILAVIGILFLVVTVMSMKKEEDESTAQQETDNVYHDIQDGTAPAVSDSKSEAYVADNRNENSTADYWDRCIQEQTLADEQEQQRSGAVTTAELFTGDEGRRTSGGTSRQYENPYRETAQEREDRHRRRQEEAVLMAERMASMESPQQVSPEPENFPEEGTVSIPSETPKVRRTSPISSLEDSAGSIGTFGDDELLFSDDGSRPFPCMFAKTTKIRNGDRISVILLEDIVISGTHIPRNTHLMATCKLSDRLELLISSLEIGGKIIPFGYEAYDIDGSKGIFCPDVGSEAKTIRSRGASIAGSTLNSRIGRVAGEMVSTGISLIQNRNGETSVSVPSGYTFFIMKKTER